MFMLRRVFVFYWGLHRIEKQIIFANRTQLPLVDLFATFHRLYQSPWYLNLNKENSDPTKTNKYYMDSLDVLTATDSGRVSMLGWGLVEKERNMWVDHGWEVHYNLLLHFCIISLDMIVWMVSWSRKMCLKTSPPFINNVDVMASRGLG